MPSPSALPPMPPHLGPVFDDEDGRGHRFAVRELAIVLSHYDVGVISRIREFRRGSRRAPKLQITAERGEFLLKRRAPGRDDPRRVAFAQDLQLLLADRDYPVPPLVPTRGNGTPMLQLDGRIYELFRFVEGTRDDKSPAAAEEAGGAMGRLHRLLAEYRPASDPPGGSYHAAAGLEAALRQIPAAVSAAEPKTGAAELESRCLFLLSAYRDAVQRAETAGLSTWPPRVLHGDWHPGNLLYRDGRIVAVLDFDSARVEPRMIDVANAALQFSMSTGDPNDPGSWPDRLDAKRIRSLLTGYDESSADPLAAEERQALPWLIIEALILESVVPIAATGRFARLRGSAFLQMVERKVRWVRSRAARLVSYVEG